MVVSRFDRSLGDDTRKAEELFSWVGERVSLRSGGLRVGGCSKRSKGAPNDKSLVASNVIHTNQFVKIAFSCCTNNLTLQAGHEIIHIHHIVIRDSRSRRALSENA